MKLGRIEAYMVHILYISISSRFFREGSRILMQVPKKRGSHLAEFNSYFVAVRIKPLGRCPKVITGCAFLL